MTTEVKKDTLGYHYDMCKVVFGEYSKATAYLEKKIDESPNGRDEKVIVAESQMVHLLMSINANDED